VLLHLYSYSIVSETLLFFDVGGKFVVELLQGKVK
jgi:hypothetical protein